MQKNEQIIAHQLGVKASQVIATVGLLDEGATVPFISRYRKELTGSLDEVQISSIRDSLQRLRELEKRKLAILKSIEDQGRLTNELKDSVMNAETMTALEDLYLPYKPKRRTRASIARENGLQDLADLILEQSDKDVEKDALRYIVEGKVEDVESALAGARDIVAEYIAEDAEIRNIVREFILKHGKYVGQVLKGKEIEGVKYKDYFDWSEDLSKIPSHRLLAMRRGEKEEVLRLNIMLDDELVVRKISHRYIFKNNASAAQLRLAIADGYRRLVKPSIETEVRMLTRQKADDEAIKVFAENIRHLLLAAPLGQKKILAIDPGFRTGCKMVALDSQGNLVSNTNVYPHNGARQRQEAEATVKEWVEKFSIDAIAIGNGTAGRETEQFVASLQLEGVQLIMVNESGASIYSASEVAREEFPDYDITVRGAVSIGRRLMDPLAELVKIEPKSIGVGQYQHDVDQSKLQSSLDDTVVSCVNMVGVELNTASKQILSYISGLGPALAHQIVEFRKENGAFRNRKELKKVPRLGEKAYEQAAGFLRIRNGEHPLDASAVHPERYALVEKMAKDLGTSVEELLRDEKLRSEIDLKRYVSENVGLPTLKDILSELAKPGLDPREQFEQFAFADGISEIADLKIGMKLPGIITNITKFGAFVDIGVHQDGLVHLSQLSNKFVSDPHEVVKVQQKVEVVVTELDVERKRISLSMKTEKSSPPKAQNRKVDRRNESSGNDFSQKLAQLASKFK